METTLDVPIQLRELIAISIDNIEKAFAFFFDAATKSIAPNSPESIALLKRVIAVKMGYARKLALAKDLSEAGPSVSRSPYTRVRRKHARSRRKHARCRRSLASHSLCRQRPQQRQALCRKGLRPQCRNASPTSLGSVAYEAPPFRLA